MSESVGQAVRMSPARRFIGDLLYAGMQMPLVTIQKDMNVADVAAARQLAPVRPSWCSIFTKAYGKVVASRPDMRRIVLSFPWERMYEYASASADITVEVRLGDENALAFVPIKHPETCPLLEIDRIVASCQEKPLELLKTFKDALLLARFCPRFLRRWVWWCLLNLSGRLRSQYFGTFGVTSVGNWGVESVRPIAPAISILHYGAIDAQGNVSVRMTYDHRVLDGSGPSKALNEMEHFLNTDLLDELKTLRAGSARRAESGLTPGRSGGIPPLSPFGDGVAPLTPFGDGGDAPLTPFVDGGDAPLTPFGDGGVAPLTPFVDGGDAP